MALYDAVQDLPLEIESYELERLEYVVSPEFTRVTTVVHLHGAGEEGVGEDVTYTATDHPPPDDLPLAGSFTLDSYSQLLDALTLFTEPPEMEAWHDYRRWAFESAALDLGLRQTGRTLVDAVEREPRPVTFVTSRRLADPPSADQIRAWLDLYPNLRFKLDPTSDWTDELVTDLAATGAIDSVDLKGQYEGTSVDQPPDPVLYQRVARRVPGRLGRGSERHRRDAPDPRAARRSHHVGRADPFGRGHREPPVAAADDQHQAVALRRSQAALRRVRLLRRARDQPLRRRPVGARPRAADRSSTSPRSSTRTRRTTSLRAATTRPSRSPDCPRARSPQNSLPRASVGPNNGLT